MISSFEQYPFKLSTYEGPLDFLLYLVQKKEIDVQAVWILEIIDQYKKHLESLENQCIDAGGEFLSLTAYLLWLKSQLLLPQNSKEINPEEVDPKFEIIHHLMEYCHYKEVAQTLADQEEKQHCYFHKGLPQEEPSPKESGIKYVNLEDLSQIFTELLKRKQREPAQALHDETWRVCDKIQWLKNSLEQTPNLSLSKIFCMKKSKTELIVIFLASLELMKNQMIAIYKNSQGEIYFSSPKKQVAV